MSVCVVNLISKFEFGQVLLISGECKKECNVYKINFCNDDDIPLAIFINHKINQIAINSFVNSEWAGDSIKIDLNLFPSSKLFKFYVLASDKQFHIAFNDQHLCDFDFQENIKTVKISGDVRIVTQVDHRKIFPVPWPPLQEDMKSAAFSHDVPAEYLPGCTIVMKLLVSGSNHGRFFLRFNERATKRQLFHFNVRYDEKVIVINSQNDSLDWMKETRIKEIPIKHDKEFLLAIAMTNSCFKVAINGRHYVAYDYRMIQTLRSSFNGHNQVFEKIVGLKLFGEKGTRIQCLELDHVYLKDECESYEILSDLNLTRRK